MIKYDKMFETMKKKGISQYALLKKHGVSAGQLDRIRRNENISTYTLNRMCEILDCRLEDIAEYIKDSNGC